MRGMVDIVNAAGIAAKKYTVVLVKRDPLQV